MDVSDYEAPPIATRVNTIVLAFTVVAGLVVSLRLFARIILTSLFGLEDVCIVLAMGLSIGLSATISQQTMHGLGRHMSQISANEQLMFLKAFWVGLWVYSLAITITKISILLQYLRIFPVHRFRIRCYCLLGLVVAFGAWAVTSNIFLCNPVSLAWTTHYTQDDCMDRTLIWYTNGGVSIAQDFMILLLPIPLIRTLQIPASQKRGFMTMFVLSSSTSIISIIRLYTIHQVAKSIDLSFDNPAHVTLSSLEVNAVIICACLPAMRPLLALMMPKYFSPAAQFTNVPMGYDVERPSTLKHIKQRSDGMQDKFDQQLRASVSGASGASNTPALQPGLSRPPSGRFTITHSRSSTAGRTATPGRASYISHSRSRSNVSIDIAAADARSNVLRPQKRIYPLRPSPITPNSLGDSQISFPVSMYSAASPNGSHADAASVWSPDRLVAAKPLPLTPFPVGTVDGQDKYTSTIILSRLPRP